MSNPTTDHAFMGEVLAHREAALQRGDCPVASIVVRDGAVVGVGSNIVATTGDATGHAEIQATRDACARHAGMLRPDYGDYAVEKLLAMTRASLQLTTDVRTEECEAMRRRWSGWVEPPAA